MKNMLRARKGGFTLVELLIVIMIIAILAGMMMLATGAATDTAEATRVINDLRAVKAAGILLYMDEGQSWDWADLSGTVPPATQTSLDVYMDRPLFTGDNPIYDARIHSDVKLQDGSNKEVTIIGFNLTSASRVTSSVKDKLKNNAERIGLYELSGAYFQNASDSSAVYMILH